MREDGTGSLSVIARAGRSFLMITLCLGLLVSLARGDDEDLRSLELYNGATSNLVSTVMVTANRSPPRR